MKKTITVTVAIALFFGTGITMASEGTSPIDILTKAIRFLRADVNQLQNQVSEIKSDTNLKVYDANGLEMGIFIEWKNDEVESIIRYFDTNVNRFVQRYMYSGQLFNTTGSSSGDLWYESPRCHENENDIPYIKGDNPYSKYFYGSYEGKYYTAKENSVRKNVTFRSFYEISTGNFRQPSEPYIIDYVVEAVEVQNPPTYTAPLKIEVR